tara:strand:- start:974 stop:1435 length:462 start_codon:yes stop_codon:yes gene_type:complete
MTKKIFFLFLLFPINGIAIELKCNFEEVYMDGSVQNGLLYIKEDLARYEYADPQLFTLIKRTKKFYLKRNDRPEIVNEVKENTELADTIINVIRDFPDIKQSFQIDKYDIDIELSKKEDFIKRISIKSDGKNLSVYFNGCENIFMDKKLFEIF